jgi:predicted PhzF superfamily epimerase YddE/YHI9
VQVRIFTPTGELPFAGHPTLGTAMQIRATTQKFAERVVLDLKAGPIPVAFSDSGLGTYGEMTQKDPEFGESYPRETVASLLGLTTDDVADDVPVQAVSTGLAFVVLPLRSLRAIRSVRMNFPGIAELLAKNSRRALYLVTREVEDTKARLHARHLFARGEDPATGSAGGCATAWMVRHGRREARRARDHRAGARDAAAEPALRTRQQERRRRHERARGRLRHASDARRVHSLTHVRTAALLLGVCALGCGGGPSPSPLPSPAATRDGRWLQDVDYLASELPRLHPNLFFQTEHSEFDRVVQEVRASLPSASDTDLVVGLMRIAATPGDPHTSVFTSEEFPKLGVRLRRLTSGLFVTSAEPALAAALGSKVLAFDGASAEAAEAR